ncbi:MAG: hypothetical protein QOI42_1953 [Frankiaceae bacterium]|nr:hypothetical protein [Frankiaceae bacterium]
MHEAPSRPAAPSRVEAAPRTPLWAMLLPAVTLVAGIGIGTLVAGAGGSGHPTAGASSTSSGSGAPAAAAVNVQVPAECLQLAQAAGTSLPNVDDATAAIKSLDLQRLQAFVSQLQSAQPRLTALAQQCRDKAASVQVVPAPGAS